MPVPTTKIIQDYNDIFVNYDPSKNNTRNIMTKYEKTAVLSLRLEQLVRGASPCIEIADKLNYTMRSIAAAELNDRKLPFVIVRTMPNDTKEYWKLEDLIILRD
jgi:DNA-directed RNA polymerase subunit K/omega